MEIKKTDRANLELMRRKMFFVALTLILSFVAGALMWDFSVSDDFDAELIDEVIQDIDFEKLKKNRDMVAAVTETEDFVENTNMKPADALVQQPKEQLTATLAAEAQKTEIEEANVEEVREMVMETKDDEPEGLHAVEELPEFPGGSGAFMKWITANVKYPTTARNRKQTGRVVVSFLVTAEGDVEELKLEKFTNSTFADAVMKAMKNMPKWKPGKQKGKPCTTMVAVPINFDL